MIARNVRIFGLDQLGALNECGYSHPNFYFKSLLLGYVSISKSGGDLSQYMERKSQEFFARTQFKYANYKSQAHVIGETLLILLTILPTMILISSFMLAGESVNTVMSVSLVLVPLVTVFIILMIYMSQPRNHDLVCFDFRAAILGGICFTVLFLAGHEPWLIVGMSVSVGAVFGYIRCLGQFREISLAESALAEFLRDITEYRKIGTPIPNALIRISKERKYNKYFDGLLGAISARLKNGTSLSEIVDSALIRSWVARTSLFVLAKVAESGGGTAAVLEQMTNFATGINQTKKETHASISVISYFAFLSPVMMAYTAKEMMGVLAKVNNGLGHITSDVFVGTTQVSGEMVDAINLLIIVSAAGVGLVMCKLVHFTMKYTIPLGVAVLIAVVSVLVLPFFPSLAKI
jgi:flagellar protein FlaJ